MITIFKIFEKSEKPEIGDYVICRFHKGTSYGMTALNWTGFTPPKEEIKNYVDNTVGQITSNVDDIRFKGYHIEFPNSSDGRMKKLSIECDITDVLYWGKTKKEVAVHLSSSRFDL